MENNVTYFIKRYYTDFIGKVQHVDYVGPYMENQYFALKAQCRFDMNRQKPGTTQITYWEWIKKEGEHEVALAHEGYKTLSFSA